MALCFAAENISFLYAHIRISAVNGGHDFGLFFWGPRLGDSRQSVFSVSPIMNWISAAR